MKILDIITEGVNNVVVIGDSIAVGLGGSEPYAKGGISTVEVLNRVKQFVASGNAKGALVILSSGASNSSPIELEGGIKKSGNGGLAPVAQQLKALQTAGATVALVGTGSTKSKMQPGTSWTGGKKYAVDLTGVNQQLESMASATGATFLGPLEDFDPTMHSGKGDGIHPYSGYSKIKQAATSVKPQKSNVEQSAQQPERKAVAPAGTFVLTVPATSVGHAGSDVMDVQKVLSALGYDLGPPGVDGIRGKYTKAAIKKYQQEHGLQVDGDAGPETVTSMNAEIAKDPTKFKAVTKSQEKDVKVRAVKPTAMKELPQDSVTKGKLGKLLNFIAAKESSGHYDMMMGGERHPEILNMTVAELLNFQSTYNKGKRKHTAAAGRYQYMPETLRGYSRRMGIDINAQKFSPEFQDKLAIYTMRYQCRLDAWLDGKVTDGEFLNLISAVWAAIPRTSGLSTYHDPEAGGNKAGMKSDYALNTLQTIRSATA